MDKTKDACIFWYEWDYMYVQLLDPVSGQLRNEYDLSVRILQILDHIFKWMMIQVAYTPIYEQVPFLKDHL